TLAGLRAKAKEETGYLALDGDRIVGCIFCAERPDSFYVGKLAIAADHQRSGLGYALMQHAEALALRAGKSALELQVRVELSGNQSAFARMGFVEIARTSHAGYDRPTSITMRKALN
ncbi:N-acetyltransferase, partial [Salmonella enterica subsp. enterica serovar Typhi]|nr:N-acetyltransferase [Salmonella enterica subsp. enterica serovar Typhi]